LLDPNSGLPLFYEMVRSGSHKVFSSERPEWDLTMQSILEAKDIAERREATLAVLIFYHIPAVYYERVMSKEISEAHYELQTARALKKFCERNGIDVIDTFLGLKKYVNGLSDPINAEKLPYFKVDGL